MHVLKLAYRAILAAGLMLNSTGCAPLPTETTFRLAYQFAGLLADDFAALSSRSHMRAGSDASPSFPGNLLTDTQREASLRCLTQAIYYEAGSESEDGQRAVAQIVLNRVMQRDYPNTVCGVVFQRTGKERTCQFSFTCDGSLHRARSRVAWTQARQYAQEAIGGYVHATVGCSIYYHADYVRPSWSATMERVIRIGAHIFYRPNAAPRWRVSAQIASLS